MIYVKNLGNCGNQLFCYAAGKYLSKIFHDEITIVSSNNQLTGFNLIEYHNAQGTNIFKKYGDFSQKITGYFLLFYCEYIQKIFVKPSIKYLPESILKFQAIFSKFLSRFGIYWFPGMKNISDIKPNIHKNKLVYGLGSRSICFALRDELREEVKPKHPISSSAKKIYDSAIQSESVCVTIRRGDFLSSKFRSRFYVCDKNYFVRAINKMKELKPNAKYYFFSDNIEWVKNEFEECLAGLDVAFEEGDNSLSEKIFMMSACKNFILSNSTFSWWAWFLSSAADINTKGVTISPDRWLNYGTVKESISDDWIVV